jgi:tetratricopeptide (TPR) repeat protein
VRGAVVILAAVALVAAPFDSGAAAQPLRSGRTGELADSAGAVAQPPGRGGALAAVRTDVPPTPRPEREPPPPNAALKALRLLSDEDVDGARALAEPLFAADPDDLGAKLAMGVLRYHEQRYAEAVALLESVESDPTGYLGLARDAHEITKGHVRAESDHFVVSHPPGKDEVLVPYLVEALERQRAALGEAFGLLPEDKLVVEILNDVRELAKVTTLVESEIRTSGTVAVAKFNKIMLLSPKALLKGYDWLDTAAHEYTHVVLTRKSRNEAPIWLQEGLAKWFEDAWRDGKEPISRVEAALVRDAVEKDRLVTFEEMHPSLAKLPSQERAALAYAQVVLAVERMVQRGGANVLGKLLDLVAEGKDAGAAVAEVLGVPFESFLADWKQHMAKRPLPRGGDHELRHLQFKDDRKHGEWSEWAEIPDEKARSFARLGVMMRTRGRHAAARIEYGKAYDRVGARFPILADQYALAAMMSGAEPLAEKVLGEAIGWNPDYAALHVHLARLLVKRQDWARAKEHLLLANRQDPFDPEIHAGLAKVLTALGDPGGASREERFAQILSGHEAKPAPAAK